MNIIKKLSCLVFAFAFFAIAASASAQGTSWQTYFVDTNTLVVHETDDRYSPVCFIGAAEEYNGYCVYPKAPSSAYTRLQRILRQAALGY